jgi:1,4-alpha-glucan branching enzyme
MKKKTGMPMPQDSVLALVAGNFATPYAILGRHQSKTPDHVEIRIYEPGAQHVEVRWENPDAKWVPAVQVHPDGVYRVDIPIADGDCHYRVRAGNGRGDDWEYYDPYQFPHQLTDFDLHLLAEGTHHDAYEKLGAHPVIVDGIPGVLFAVWAPNASRVSVVGDFNHWNGLRYPMQSRGSSGIWELFIPEMTAGAIYKYEVKSHEHGAVMLKGDPFAFQAELRPKTASVVCKLEGYDWGDDEWMHHRRNTNWLERPLSFYEVHMGSWKRQGKGSGKSLSYRELAEQMVPYVKDLGFTHIELMPPTEHPLDESWGYQTTAYYAPTSRFGKPDDFMYLVDQCHQAGLGVIIDWVPAHFPKDAHGLARFDGTALYEHADPRQGEHPDWGTLVFNYGRNEVRNFLLSNALFWLREYHIDGLRIDAVASMLYLDYSREEGEWIPNRYGSNENLDAAQFLRDLNVVVHAEYPGVLTIAEESTAWPMVSRPVYLGGLGFSLKWNMGWMHDMLEYISKEPVHRMFHHGYITFGLLYATTENFQLVISHDEVVHGKRSLLNKMPGDDWQKFANCRLFFGYMYTHPGKKLLFMGAEFGQWAEWQVGYSLDWHLLEHEPHQQLHSFLRDLNHLYQREPALYEIDFDHGGFEWIDFHDTQNSIIVFLRNGKTAGEFLVVVCNFTPVPRMNYRIGVPVAGRYQELLNSDAACYGGGNIGNYGGIEAEQLPCHERPASMTVNLPPLGVLIFKLDNA